MNNFKVSIQFRYLSATNSCKHTIVPVHWLLVAFAIVCMPSNCNGMLDTGEKAALHQLFEAFPALAHVPKWWYYDTSGQYLGRNWSDNYDNLCLEDGYEYYGVHCSSGHVDGLFMYVLRPYQSIGNSIELMG